MGLGGTAIVRGFLRLQNPLDDLAARNRPQHLASGKNGHFVRFKVNGAVEESPLPEFDDLFGAVKLERPGILQNNHHDRHTHSKRV